MSHTETFATLPNAVMRRKDLSHGAKLCAARLIQYADKRGVAFPRLPTLAAELGMSVSALKRYLHELVELKLVRPRRRGQGRSNEYYLAEELLIHRAGFHSPKVGHQEGPKPASPERPQSGHPYNKREKEIKSLAEITGRLVDKLQVGR